LIWRKWHSVVRENQKGPLLKLKRDHSLYKGMERGQYPKLREHLGSVVAIMKLSADWYDFRAKLDRLHPRYGKPTQLSLELSEEDEPDTGKGL
jgi:hypothetical protein